MKEEIGSESKDVPMLDVRQYGDKLGYCDIDVSLWIKDLKLYYTDQLEYKYTRAELQFIIHTLDKSEVYINLTTGKIMVQPEQKGKDQLLGFLSKVSALAIKRPNACVSADRNEEAEPDCETATSIPMLTITPAAPNSLDPVQNVHYLEENSKCL